MALKNLLVRIGADASGMQAGLQKATKSLDTFKRDTDKRLSSIGKGRGGGVSLSRVSSGAAKSTGLLGESLSGLTKHAGVASSALEGLAARLGSVGAAAGVAVLAVGAIAGAVALIGKGAQPAAKQESALMRLNLALGAGAKSYREWGEANAAALGLSERSIAEFGSTYGLVLKGSIRDSKQLTKATEDLVRTTQIVASATGRSVQDVSERFRSGMLGETDAIEDLGIQVSASVIKTTKAFKELSKGKTWAQISDSNPALQKQIILMAILEQAQKQYGDSLQNNVITKQQSLSAALDDLKLHWSQVVLPIWKAVLPALTALVHGLDNVAKAVLTVERFLGMDVGDVKALDDTTAGLGNVSSGYDAVADSAKKAKLGVAAFDEVNQLNWPDDSGAAGSGPGSSSGGSGRPSSGGSKGGTDIPPVFPPDAGKGVDSFWENIKSTVLAKVTALRDGLVGEGGLFPGMVTGVEGEFQGLRNGLAGEGGIVPGLAFSVSGQFAQMRSQAIADSSLTTAGVTAAWQGLNVSLIGDGGAVPATTTGVQGAWSGLQTNLVGDGGIVPMTTAGILAEWRALSGYLVEKDGIVPYTTNVLYNKWDYLGQRLAVKEPETTAAILKTWDNLRLGLVEEKGVVPVTTNTLFNKWDFLNTRLMGDKGLIPLMTAGILASWTATMVSLPVITSTALGKVFEKTRGFASDMVTEIGKVTTAFSTMMSAMAGAKSASPSGAGASSTVTSPVVTPPVTSPAPSSTGRPAWVDNTPLLGDAYAWLDTFSDKTKPFADFIGQFYVPGGGGALSGAGSGLANAGSVIGKYLDDAMNYIGNLFSGVPAFADGAITNGPMLAMIGDNVGGEEVVSPLDDLMGMIQTAVGTAVLATSQASGGGQPINLSIDGVTLARIVAPYLKGETQRIGGSLISAF